MRIKFWYLTGDTHQKDLLSRLHQLKTMPEVGVLPQNIGIIILGDAGLNFYLDSREQKFKKKINHLGYQIYCVYGNHEERPENISTMKLVWDKEVKGEVYVEEKYPNIKYFKMFGEYQISRYNIAVIGGAYSVDKEFRQLMNWQWFPDEQLTEREIIDVFSLMTGKDYDLVLTHTCPYDWRPIDLFLQTVDQSKVDSTMERTLNFLKDYIRKWDKWACGHYHDDRMLQPNVIMLYHKIINLEDLMNKDNPFLEGIS